MAIPLSFWSRACYGPYLISRSTVKGGCTNWPITEGTDSTVAQLLLRQANSIYRRRIYAAQTG